MMKYIKSAAINSLADHGVRKYDDGINRFTCIDPEQLFWNITVFNNIFVYTLFIQD